MMKIGLLGGSFNPIHNGHLILAQTVKKALHLQQIWLLPTANHPFKEKNFVVPFSKRIELIKQAIICYPDIVVKEYDSAGNGFNYTSDLLKKLYQRFPEHDFYFIIGEDNVEELPQWHEFEWLLKNANFVVVNRPTSNKENKPDYAANFLYVSMEPIPISSTEIREKISQGKSIEKDVPSAIKEEVYRLYSFKGK